MRRNRRAAAMASDGVRRLYGEAIVEGGPWLVSVGIPMSVAYRARVVALDAQLHDPGARVERLARRGRSCCRAGSTKSVAHLEGAAQRIASGDFSPIEPQPMPTREFERAAAGVRPDAGAASTKRARALDAQMAEERRMRRGAAVAAAAGDPAGAPRRGRPARVRRRARDQQPAAGDSRLRRAAADAGATCPTTVKTDLMLIQKESARACGIIRNLALFARQQTGRGRARAARRRHHLGRRAAPAAARVGGHRAARRGRVEAAGAGGDDRAAAGRAQLRRQRRAGDRHVRPPARAASPSGRATKATASSSRSRTPGRAFRTTTRPSCSSRSSRPSRSARAPASASRSATASSTRSAGTSATVARPPAARSSTSICLPRPATG